MAAGPSSGWVERLVAAASAVDLDALPDDEAVERWVGALVADLVVNRPLGLRPQQMEFKRAHLYDINPVGVGAMLVATVVSISAFYGLFGPVAKALSPARVREVLVDDDNKQATVIVPDDQLSLAIGREGQNARLAARLTGWRIDIRSETDFASQDEEEEYAGEEETGGRCAAVNRNGRRCPNAALPGSR